MNVKENKIIENKNGRFMNTKTNDQFGRNQFSMEESSVQIPILSWEMILFQTCWNISQCQSPCSSTQLHQYIGSDAND